MRQAILFFGGLSIAILLLFQLNKLSLMGFVSNNNIFLIISGCLFISIGFIINQFIYKKRAKESGRFFGKAIPGKTKLSKQEYKVLTLMADGLSNVEIAENLFISESTVKTHVSNILTKLRAKRRTEAVKIGRDLQII